MDIKDIKVGMKVKLLGKHRVYDEYDNIEDWFDYFYNEEDVQQIKKQGYGVIVNIDRDGDVWVSNTINGSEWCFLPSDLEPYETEKTPKEWLLTPKAVFVTRNSEEEYVVLGNNTAISVDSGCMWDDDLVNNYTDNLRYYDDCPFNDIMKIEYEGKVVWKRKVNYVSFDEAIKSGKRIKNKKWVNFYTLQEVLGMLSSYLESTAREEISGLWEIEE